MSTPLLSNEEIEAVCNLSLGSEEIALHIMGLILIIILSLLALYGYLYFFDWREPS
jgi:hypothetical protein